jgi:hypothetical protein
MTGSTQSVSLLVLFLLAHWQASGQWIERLIHSNSVLAKLPVPAWLYIYRREWFNVGGVAGVTEARGARTTYCRPISKAAASHLPPR